jgi:hypothetical protein
VNVCFDGPLNKMSMNVNFVILIENGYVLHDCCEGDVLRDTTIGNEKVVEGTQNDFLNLH